MPNEIKYTITAHLATLSTNSRTSWTKELKKRGFKYLGTITVYSHLQACGIINDHGKDCPCYQHIVENYPTVRKRRYLEK